jgi:hypothetical protein
MSKVIKKKSGQNIIFLGKVIGDNEDITYTKLKKAQKAEQDIHIFYCRPNEHGSVLYARDCYGKILKLTKKILDLLVYNGTETPEEQSFLLKFIENVTVQRTVKHALQAIEESKTINELESAFDNYIDFGGNAKFMDKYRNKRTELEKKFKDR